MLHNELRLRQRLDEREQMLRRYPVPKIIEARPSGDAMDIAAAAGRRLGVEIMWCR
jgi:hypothetical protein